MKYFALASTLLATVFAAPAAQGRTENIDITDFFVRKTGDKIVAFDFKLSGNDAKDLVCKTGAIASLPSDTITCGDSNYRFVLTKGKETEFALSIYHQTGIASGLYASGTVPTHCRAGGAGPDDFICGQVGAVTIVIAS
jgi:hypothetical protein